MIIKRKDLLAALNRMKFSIKRSSILPQLQMIYVKFKGDKLNLIGTDLEIYVYEELDAQEHYGKIKECLVDFYWIYNIILNSECEYVKIEDNGIFQITCERFKHTIIPNDKTEEYPKTPVVDDVNFSFSTDINKFKLKVATALKFASNDDLRPALTGISLEKRDDNRFNIISTDTHMLYFDDADIDYSSESFSNCILSKNICQFLAKNMKGVCKFSFNKWHIVIENETTKVVSRLIDMPYPNWREVVGYHHKKFNIIVDRKQFIQIINLARILSNNVTRMIKVCVTGGSLKLSVDNDEIESKSSFDIDLKESVAIKEPFNFALNSIFIQKALRISKEKDVVIESSGIATKAFIVDSNILLMPLMLNDNG